MVSSVGYTNAGKSTLLNTLTHSHVDVKNRLFETLDPSSRRLRFPREREAIITDTVGFIRDLPESLMEAFAATGCTACHSGPVFNGPAMPVGSAFLVKVPTFPDSAYVGEYALADDPGRFSTTGTDSDRHLWRVPTLRNLQYTAPYMHNGTVKDLAEAVRVMGSTQLGQALDDAQVQDMVAFLMALSGTFPDQTMPRLPATPGDLLE